METQQKVETVKIDFKCPKCNDGHLRPTGMALTTHPAQFPHKCTDCEYGETFYKTYPYIDYR